MTNMAIGAIYIGIVLCQAFQVIDCCTFKPFEDSRCYLELVNQQYIVRSNPDGAHIDFTQCILVNGELHNPHSVHRQECDQALSGQTVYVSHTAVHQSAHQTQTSSSHSSSIAISASGSSSSNSSHSSHHYNCYHNHRYYREIFGEAERVNCHRTYSVFDKLDYLRQNDHYCLSTLVQEMAGLKYSDCECSDSSSNIQYSFRGQQYYHHNCMNHPTYKDIITRYLSYVPYNMGVMEPSAKCHTRYQLWQDLLRLRSSGEHHATCFDQFVHHMNEAYHTHSEPPCSSCHIPTAHTNADHNYNAYIKGDCLSEHTVWSFLMEEHSTLYHGQNRETLIEHMAALYPDGTDNKCVCSKTFDLHYPHTSSEDYHWSFACSNSAHGYNYYPSSYQNAITHLFGSPYQHQTRQTCHSHAAVWHELNRIVKHNHDPVRCLETLIHILRDAVEKQGDPCHCHPVASTTRPTETTTKMTTTTIDLTTTQSTTKSTTAQPTTKTTQLATLTTKPTTTRSTTATTKLTTVAATQTSFNWVTIKNTTSSTVAVGHTTQCLKIHTIEELAKYQQMYPELNTDCSNHISTSNLIVRSLCPSVPVTQNWKPGVKVTESCDILKTYIPVATFTPSSEYPPDGLAGVFLGCTDSSIKIATQECGGRFSILELPRQPAQSESFTNTASNYHVVMY
ncbi:uncharacterized protein [Magallana gigas]|uniref:uncharacterized protein isoform X1 n=1 Tax=Magallana gigas TaxID=29159 RepID=UPI00333EF8B5